MSMHSVVKRVQVCFALVAVVISQFLIISLAAFAAGGYVTLSSFSGTPGTTLSVSGGGWTVGDTISIYLNSASGSPVATATVNADTNFTANVAVPATSSQGPLPIVAVSTSNDQASNSFYVVPLFPTITVNAPSHAPFADVKVSGSGYAPNETVNLELGGATASTQADNTGSFSAAHITVPKVASTLYHLNVTGASSAATTFDYFWIDTFYPNVAPSAYYLVPGAVLSFTGGGFASNEIITVTETGASTIYSTFTANASGSFELGGGFNLPASFQGMTKNFTLTGSQSGSTASMGMTVGAFYGYASPSTYYLLPGETLSFTGGGFAGNESIGVYRGLATTPITRFTTNDEGGFEHAGGVSIPFSASNSTISFRLVGEESAVETSVSTGVGSYYPSITPSEYYVTPNTEIEVSGSGFAADETVSFSVNGFVVSTATADTDGNVLGEVMIPFGGASATIGAQGGMSNSPTSVGVTLATFYPGISPSSYYLFPGDDLTFTGSGFVPGESVTIVSGVSSSTVTADEDGTFETDTVSVPFSAIGTLTTTFTGALSNNAVVSNIGVGGVAPYLNADLYSATGGDTIKVSGSRFGARETVRVIAGSYSTEVRSDRNGNTREVSIRVPYGALNLPITFTGLSTGAAASLTVNLRAFNASASADNYYALPGSTITVTGSGFAPSEGIQITGGTVPVTLSADVRGNVSGAITLPFGTTTSAVITVRGIESGAESSVTVAYAPFNPLVSPSTYYTTPGSVVIFEGTGFAPSETVNVTFNGTPVTAVTATDAGSFSFAYTLPYGSTMANIVFRGVLSNNPQAQSISLAPFSAFVGLSSYYAQGGTPLIIAGSGFRAGEMVRLSFDGEVIGTTPANSFGSFTWNGTVPFRPAGNKPVQAIGLTSGAMSGTTFTVAQVYTDMQLGEYAGDRGEAVTVVGHGYLPNEPVTIMTDRTGITVVHTFTTDASGNFNNSGFIIPTSYVEGTLVLIVTGTHSFDSKSITYYVTGN